jgi:hypothetical protein
MKSESLARGGVMTMTSMNNLNGCSHFGGVCAAYVGSQVGWVFFGVLCDLGRVLSVVGRLGPVCIGFCPVST